MAALIARRADMSIDALLLTLLIIALIIRTNMSEQIMHKLLSLASLVAVAGCTSMGTQSPSSTALAKNGQPGVTCRSYRETGSIMPGKRICHNAAEWAAIDAQQKQEASTMLGKTGRQGGTGGDLN